VGRLLDHYYEAYAGIGVHKSPELYGAFPTDPYSHTPASKGAQQPGMTGQVKEDVLSRFGELGVFVEDGRLHFDPCLLKKEEFLSGAESFTYVDLERRTREIQVEKDSLCFTCCQVPVIYHLSDQRSIVITHRDGTVEDRTGLELDHATSTKIFDRLREVVALEVALMPGL